MGGGYSIARSVSHLKLSPTSDKLHGDKVNFNDAEVSADRMKRVERFIKAVYISQNQGSNFDILISLIESKQSR
jgi:hypothetical protein